MEKSVKNSNKILGKLQSYNLSSPKSSKLNIEAIEEYSNDDKTIDSIYASSTSSPMSTRALPFSNKLNKLSSPLSTFKGFFTETDSEPSETPSKLSKIISLKPNKHENCITTEAYELQTDIETPQLVWCAYCKAERTTEIEYLNNSTTFLSSVGIFLMGGVLGCFLVPYAINSCKTPKVLCSKCKHRLN
ncbi:hypothetical protein SteCoe_12836 [Stentor coeruleus]|uniref:LITAF domain-containing protein n=1 Tax=Stentor coeruleus TaxID=5963 RepID=A0A1R2C9X1_9CILI|nr:hypothetical protein SteCoe_12836 [Stentor coeruleus]